MKPLNRLLIANRGEIVSRIARSARRLGITTIAICSDADLDSPHATACDECVPIGGRSPADSYLDAAKIIAAASRSGAQAVHPGYGFLAENAAFAAAVESAGLIFVGPPAAAIEAMGDKARARQRMTAAGIRVVPGYDGDEQTESRLRAEAARIGFPVMVKAAAGGGGRGMRRVTHAEALPAALASATAEARSAFGDGRLVLERALADPRHVEVQVIADAAGLVLSLGERDCSIQRRHQKIVEEAPSPAVDPTLRARMGEAAVTVAREVGYRGAGTVEFLLDPSGEFYFMEMNTRLQVEHPVTECVTGRDVVELQLRIARGEELDFAQSDVRIRGHAVEVRLCAEAPGDGFLPRSGSVVDWRPGPHVRSDDALAVGLRVGPEYDSMLAKLVAYGTTRAEAIDRLAHALDRSSLLGIDSNRAFLARVLRHPAFADGTAVSTGFIDQWFPRDADRSTVPDAATWVLAAWLSVAAAAESGVTSPRRAEVPLGGDPWINWTNGRPLPVPWRLDWQAAGGDALVEQAGLLRLSPDSALVEVYGDEVLLRGVPVPPRQDGRVEIDGTAFDYRYAWLGKQLWLHLHAGDYAFACRRLEPRCTATERATATGELRATINGRVVAVCVAPQDTISAGQPIVVLEAMKMEHAVTAPRDGVVESIEVETGLQVAPGQVLMRYAREC